MSARLDSVAPSSPSDDSDVPGSHSLPRAQSSFDPAAELEADGRPRLQVRLALWGKVTTLVTLVYWPLWGLSNGLAALLDFVPTILVGSASFGAMWLVGRGRPRSLPTLERFDVAAHAFIGTFIGIAMFTHPNPKFHAVESLTGIMYLNFVRAVLLPSDRRRTILAGAALVLPPILGVIVRRDAMSPGGIMPDQFATLYAAWSCVSVAIAAVASATLYGLGREVHDARRLGQYTLIEELGRGGMGVVYRAQHGMLRRPTAVKLLNSDGSAPLERFEREVQMMAELNHPNVAIVHDYGRTKTGVFYYAMELLDGIDLQQLVDLYGQQPAARVVHVLRQACRGLARAQEVGLVHRDIKPANMFLCRNWGAPDVLKLLDFGLVKKISRDDHDAVITRDEQILGTPLYMAPEALLAPDSVDARADLYALGAVAYFLLTGEPVFTGRNLVEVSAHHLHSQPAALEGRTAEPLSQPLRDAVLRCLAKEPQARFASAHEFQEALSNCPEADGWSDAKAAEWWQAHEQPKAVTKHDPIGYLDTININP